MSWSSPLTAVANAALTAAQWNASVRDNLAETAPAKATTAGSIFATTGANSIAERVPSVATQGTSDSTTSTVYTSSLASTSGPATGALTTGPRALVSISAQASSNTGSSGTFMSFAVSGSTTVTATDASALVFYSPASGIPHQGSRTVMQTLTPGSNTFTCQYRVPANTGTWGQRSLTVIPF